jgi:hypothetical protein
MDNLYYRTEVREGKTVVVCYGQDNWKDNEPFDGIEVTDEPFNINDYYEWELLNGVWVKIPVPELPQPE